MRFLENIRIGRLLLSSFVGLALLSLVVSSLGLFSMRDINRGGELTYANDLVGLSHAKDVNITLLAIGRDLRNAMLAPTAERREAALKAMHSRQASMRESLEQARPLFYSERGKTLFAQLDREMTAYEQVLQRTAGLLANEPLMVPQPSTQMLMGEFSQQVGVVDGLITELSGVKRTNASQTHASNVARYESSAVIMLALVAAALAVGVLLGVVVTRTITRQLGGEPRAVTALARSYAAGDLSQVSAAEHRHADSLMAAMHTMRDQLVQIVANVRGSAEGVAAASQQIAQGNNDLSARTEQQASALEETAASMEQLSASVRLNADNAQQGKQLSAGATAIAARGGEVVAEVVGTMKGINESSRRIGDIVGVIDSIAFQTNILALNAAVEAARAGEHGRGFAVVASEVRGLARRCADSAKEIRGLIGASVGRVEQGSALVDKAGATMEEVVQAIQRVAVIVDEISAASAEQSLGVRQISEVVVQMDQATQQNAALVEESAAAASSMRQQADEMVQAVSVFRLPGDREAGGRSPAPRRLASSFGAARQLAHSEA